MGDKNIISFDDFFSMDLTEEDPTKKKKKKKRKVSLDEFFTEEFKKPKYIDNVEDQEYDHISQDDFLDISGKGFGLFTEGREEIMQAKLYETYNPNNDEDGIQFEQYGSGNNIRVILPNGKQELFALPGISDWGGVNEVEAKQDYIKLVEFIESGSRRKKISEGTLDDMEDALVGEQPDFTSTLKNIINPINYGVLGLVKKDSFDDIIVDKLKSIKDGDGVEVFRDYKFEPANLFTNAITVTTPNGVKKTFNIENLKRHSIEKRKEVLNSIVSFIESDPRDYTNTKEYNDELDKLNKRLDTYFKQFLDDPKSAGQVLLSDQSRADFLDRIKTDLRTTWGLNFGMDGRVFKDITRDQQNDLINQRVNSLFKDLTSKITDINYHDQIAIQEKEGMDLTQINDDAITNMGARQIGKYDSTIWRLNQAIDKEEDLAKKKVLQRGLNAIKFLKEESGEGKETHFVDMISGEIVLNKPGKEGEGIIDLTQTKTLENGITIPSIGDKTTQVLEKKLTREELKNNAIKIELASVREDNKWNNDEHLFLVSENPWKEFWNTTPVKGQFESEEEWEKRKKLFEKGVPSLISKLPGYSTLTTLGSKETIPGIVEEGKEVFGRSQDPTGPFGGLYDTPGFKKSMAESNMFGQTVKYYEREGLSNEEAILQATKDWEVVMDPNNLVEKDGKIYIKATDAWARKFQYGVGSSNQFNPLLANLDEDYEHMSRLQLGINLKVDRLVLDGIYGRNEGVESVQKAGIIPGGLSAFTSGFVKSLGVTSLREVEGSPISPGALSSDEIRQSYLDMYYDLGVTPTKEEEKHVKTSWGETIGSATSMIPRIAFDFWLGNKVLGAVGATRFVGNVINVLKRNRYAINIGGKITPLTRGKLIKHISKTSPKGELVTKNPFKITKPGSDAEKAVVSKWIADYAKIAGVTPEAISVPASFINRSSAVLVNSLFEGVKMEVAMQMPAVHGIGYDPETAPELGGSYATGFGFGLMGGIIPWNSMYTGVFGKKALGKGFKLGKKEIGYKGIYDYTVAAPISFAGGVQLGSFTNQIVDGVMENKEWSEWLDENYGDWDHVLKHTVSDLIMGFAMKTGHFNKFDFRTEGNLIRVRQAARKGLSEVYEEVIEGTRTIKDPLTGAETKVGDGRVFKKDKKGMLEELPGYEIKNGKLYEKVVIKGKKELVEVDGIFKKGKTLQDAERYGSLISMSNSRLVEIQDTKMYLDPYLGPAKMISDMKPLLKELGKYKGENVEGNTRFIFDKTMGEGMNITWVKKGDPLNNGKINKSENTILEAKFNPKYVNPGYAPHELLHIGMDKVLGEDVMFKIEVIDGLIVIAKQMKFIDGTRLYDKLVDAGVLKEGREHEIKLVKEWELFAYIGQYFGAEGNQKMLEEAYGFDKLGSWLQKTTKDKFGLESNFNTQKELVQWFSNYGKTLKKSKGFVGSMKHLEKFISPTKTKNQQKRREEFEGFRGKGTSREMRTQDLRSKIERKREQLKLHPALQQWKDDEITTKEYIEKTKKLQDDIKIMKENLKNMPEDVIWGKESPIEKKINDFARVVETIKDPKTGKEKEVGRLMTEKEWNAKGGGKEKAINELYDWSKNGAFTNLITEGISFPIKGRSREQWLEDVLLGIEGKGRKDKTTGEEKATFISTGIRGIIERFNYKFDRKGNIIENLWGTKEQNNSLSGWINSQYDTFRRGEVFKYYEKNPVPKPIDALVGEGVTVGDILIAGESYKLKRFMEEDLSFGKTKEDALEWKDIVKVQGIKLKYELPITIKEFKKKGGWEETVLSEVPAIKNIEDVGPKDIMEIGIEWTHAMMGVKLTPSQKKNPNELGEGNLENLQKFTDKEWEKQVTEVGVDKETGEIKEKQQRVDKETGEPVFKTIKNVETMKAVLNKDATIKFDKGVSEKLKGTSSLKKLGSLAKLFHKATTKDYKYKELIEMGYIVNETPHKDGSWRVATGPGGAIWLPGKSKGKPITSKDIKEFLGKKKDGSWIKLSEDRSLAGKGRRVMEVLNGEIVEQVLYESSNLDANTLWNLRSSKSRKLWTNVKTLGLEKDAYNIKTFLEEVRTPAYYKEFNRQMKYEMGREDGSGERAVVNSLVYHFTKIRVKTNGKFNISDTKLRNIGKEIVHEFKFTRKVTPEVIAAKAEKAVKLPTDLEVIENLMILNGAKNIEVIKGPGKVFDNEKGDMSGGYAYEYARAKRALIEHGDGYYEAHLLSGAAEGGGVGKYATVPDMIANIVSKLRYSVLRGAHKDWKEDKGVAAEEGYPEYDGNAMTDAVRREVAEEQGIKVSELKKYTGKKIVKDPLTGVEIEVGIEGTKKDFKDVGQKNEVWKTVVEKALEEGREDFDAVVVDKLFKFGEKNKEVLLESVEDLLEAYINGDVNQRVVRQWVEMHAGNMFGLIKTSASLAVLPNMTLKEMIKEFGSNPADYVLEHMTPAKYVKARIYHYILSKGDPAMKEAMELTLRDHHTTLIPEKYDTMVNKTLKEDLPSSHLPGMDPAMRYFNVGHPSDFNLGLKAFAGYRVGTVYDYHPNLSRKERQKMEVEVGKNIRKLFPKTLRKGTSRNLNSKNLEHLRNIDKAMAEGRKADKKRRGMSTWDFDDTLAITKSGVRATIPNPSGKPKPSRKVIFLAGGAGSGKGNVIKKLGLEKQGFKIVNQDISLEWLKKNNGLPENMNDLTKEQRSTLGKLGYQARQIAKGKMMKYQGDAEGVVVDGTGGSIKAMEGLVKEFKGKGYDVSMLFVETSLKTALERNKARKERSLLDKMVEKNHEAVQGNKLGFRTMFGERFMEVKTDKLKQEDAMPEDLVGKMNDFVSGYEKIRLDAEQYATEGKDILDRGGEFDFTEFGVVTKGEKGPFFQKALERTKKFGAKDTYVLTARPPEAQIPIHEFLKSQGLDIPLKNITGLGNSTGEAKALWMLEKFAEGYNDIYFADDAMMNVKAVRDVLEQVDVRSKVVQVKVQKEKDLNSVKDVDRLDSPDTYGRILWSKSLRSEYEKTIAKHRPDLVKEGLVSNTVDEMFKFIDGLNVPVNKRKKYERITTKWLATSNIKLKEDGYKIKEAVDIAEKYKEDIFSYKNPNELIEKYAGKIKAKPTDPKTVKEFSKGKVTNKEYGITEYEVSNTKEGQQAVRDVMDTHFGEKSNPWCLAQKKDGKLTDDAWMSWRGYEKSPKSMVFQDGKLIAFKGNGQYWDRMDNATDFPVINIKEGRVTKTVELVDIGGGRTEQFVMKTRTTSKDKKTVTTDYHKDVERQGGMYVELAGTKIVENKVNGITVKKTEYRPNGNLYEISEFKNGKVISTRTFMPDGKRTKDINNTTALSIKEHGDMISHEIRDGKTDYWFGVTLLKGKGVEIGFKTNTGFEVMDVMKRVNGKLRVDLNKLRKIDPEVQGLPKEAKPQIKIEAPTATLRDLQPVKEVLDQLDIKSDVQQARSLNTKSLSKDFNKILEEVTGIEEYKVFSEAKGALVGKKKGKWKLFGTPGAEDFAGLVTYAFAGKGEQGEVHKKFFENNLQKPFSRAYNDIHARKQNIANDYKALRKEFKGVRKILSEEVDNVYTVDNAIRVYLWNKAGFEIPGLSKTDLKTLTDFVNRPGFESVKAFAENLSKITMLPEGYLKPAKHWLGENITMDMNNVVDRIYRKEALAEFIQNREAIFGKWEGGRIVGDNMNKIESAYGPKHREALENILWRMENGTNRTVGADSNTNKWMNWVNSATGTIMFFNQKSAVLQTISSLNYVNGTFNNPFRAAQAFANQPQYWKDFAKIFNSDMLLQRRAGLKINIEAAELIDRVGGSENGFAKFRALLLEKGFIPTKYADSFAIASGGATFYRNSVRKYKKQGLSTKEAEAKAWEDFAMMTEATQQSSRPDLISMQQASALGRPILAFANTPMQMFRRHKRRIQDIANRRGNTAENVASALYYGFAQTVIFSFLANAMFAVDDESDDPDDIAFSEKKKSRHVNTILDSYLRGMGTGGAGIAAFKNGLLSFVRESEKDYNADYGNVVIDMLNVSPPIGSKARKVYSAGKTWKYNKEVVPEMGLDFDNPAVMAIANVISATTNIPTDRVVMKLQNIRDASIGDFENWERIAMFLGVNKWQLGIGKESPSEIRIEEIETRLKKEKKDKKKKKKGKVRSAW